MKHSHILKNGQQLIIGLCMLSACATAPTTTPLPQNTETPKTSLNQLQLPDSTSNTTSPSSQNSPPAPVFPLPQYSLNTIWYWEVTSETAPTSYLVGTLHGNFSKGFSLPTDFVQAFTTIETLFLESDISVIEASPNSLIQRIVDPEAFLGKNMQPEELEEIANRLKNGSLPPEAIPLSQPWFVNVSLSSPPKDVIVDAKNIMDLVIEKLAGTQQKKVAYLETAFELFDGVAAVPPAEHVRLIRETLKRADTEVIKETVDTFEIYNTLNQTALISAGEKIKAESEPLFKATQSDRNIAWGNKLIPVMQNTPIMVAVGALHMVGETGLVAQLESKGFSVKFMGEKP